MTDQYPTGPTRSGLERFIGGSPAGVAVRLVLLSLVVGFLMTMFGINAQQVVQGAIDMVREAFRDGAGIFRNLGGYVLTGAAIVVPIWFILRLTKAR
jgi:hypothetical protein